MSLSDLPLTFVDYERENTGRAWLNRPGGSRWAFLPTVKLKSMFRQEPGHPSAEEAAGCFFTLDVTAENLTQKQAAALATILQRFARTGSIVKGYQA